MAQLAVAQLMSRHCTHFRLVSEMEKAISSNQGWARNGAGQFRKFCPGPTKDIMRDRDL